MEINVSKISLSLSIHATENVDKNIELFTKITNGIKEDQIKIEESELEGGYGNKILFLQANFTKNSAIEKILTVLRERLTISDKKTLDSEFEERFDLKSTSFFIRLDKDKLNQDVFKVTNSANVLKIVLNLRAYVKKVEWKQFLISKGILE